MVLRRDEPVKIWGQTHAGEKVAVVFIRQERSTKANRKGGCLVSPEPYL